MLTVSTVLKGVALALLFAAVIGSIAGFYPAWLAIRTPPAQTLGGRGNSETNKGTWLRHIVTVAQFAIGMCFAGVALTLAWQTHFARSTDRGFDPAPIVTLQLADNMTLPANQSLRDAVARLPDVTAVAVVHDMIGQTAVNNTSGKKEWWGRDQATQENDQPRVLRCIEGATAGRSLAQCPARSSGERRNIVIEAAVAQALGFATPQAALGQSIVMDGETVQIVGIAPQISMDSIVFSEPTKPIIYRISRKADTMLIRQKPGSNGNLETLKAELEKLGAQHFPGAHAGHQTAAHPARCESARCADGSHRHQHRHHCGDFAGGLWHVYLVGHQPAKKIA